MPTQRREEKRGGSTPAHGRKRERPPPFGSSFYMISLPPGPAPRKLGKPAGLFVLPEVLTPVFGPSFVPFSRAFPFLVF